MRVHDPFELVRWLAFSQPDPRKALAELVQNSLDAQARTILVRRVRQRGIPCLRIRDDGEGVIPELERAEALRYVAMHIGHSRKRTLTPQERLELMTQGQYGIGLLGFWSLGETLEMRSCMPGQGAHRLILYRDRPDYLIEPLRGRLPFDERWTEVVVAGLHREVLATLVGRRAADYLGAELRGQLLEREVELVVEDRMARGRAQKVIQVRPRRFLGDRLEGIGPLEVPGHRPLRLEIYLAGEGEAGSRQSPLSVYAAGTLVVESFAELAPLGLDRTLIKNLQRAFRDFYRQRPKFALLPVEGRRDSPSGPAGSGAARDGEQALEAGAEALPPAPPLLPPGPLAAVCISPAVVRAECGGEARARARGLDSSGRPIEEPLTYRWRLTGPVGRLKVLADASRVVLTTAREPAEGMLAVEARSSDRLARSEAPVAVLEELPTSGSDEGIPEPELVDLPGAAWRSRLLDGRWQVNAGHGEYREIADRPALKLRYLALLFAKEVVLRSSQDPRLEAPLEQLVEVAAYADRRLAGRRPRPRARKSV